MSGDISFDTSGTLSQDKACGEDRMPVEQLRFTHDTIRSVFHGGSHRGHRLYDLVNDLCKDADAALRVMPPLEVVWFSGCWRALSNRRLWCLKAYMGLSGLAHLDVPVRVMHALPSSFLHKNTTLNDGHTVQVVECRGSERAVGRHAHDEGAERLNKADAPLCPAGRKGRPPCQYFLGSGCFKGTNCRFSHTTEGFGAMEVPPLPKSTEERRLEALSRKLLPVIQRHDWKCPTSILYELLTMDHAELLRISESETRLRDTIDEIASKLTS
eukprot:TRINITY_DN62241_c0_g1_i1.p1 TRINITY_DN62241_c0_g1~~TRINITY_DN62241_c0_g1_i1.p1  ORF type:complete len:301 (+),score=25.23 TRINITY_DN62241_c0_g1_i1:95-904(+)